MCPKLTREDGVMNKQRMLVIVNIMLGVLVISQFATLFFMEFVGAEWTKEFHEINGFILFGLILVHVVLNWQWIKHNVFKRRPS